MISLVLVTEAQRTERMVTALIFLLLAVAVMLALLTAWYWRHTDPRRYARRAPLQNRQPAEVAAPFGENDRAQQWGASPHDPYRGSPPRDRTYG